MLPSSGVSDGKAGVSISHCWIPDHHPLATMQEYSGEGHSYPCPWPVLPSSGVSDGKAGVSENLTYIVGYLTIILWERNKTTLVRAVA